MYSIQMIQREVINTCRDADVPAHFLPMGKIKINTRLRNTLGRVCYTYGGMITNVEFNKELLEEKDEEWVHQIILHECAHVIAIHRDGIEHGHDKFFKSICAEIGCSFDKTVVSTKEKMRNPELTKYSVVCPHCNEVIGRYKRWCPTLKNLSNCTCDKCGNGNLEWVQNW